MGEKPKRCGWCGEMPTLDDQYGFQMVCDECDTSGPRCDSEERARDAWDRVCGLKEQTP